MFYYIDQPCTSYFPIGFVKIKSDFIVISVETVLGPCCAWKCVPTTILGVVVISKGPVCYLLRQMSSQWRSQKLLQGLMSHELSAYLSVFDNSGIPLPVFSSRTNLKLHNVSITPKMVKMVIWNLDSSKASGLDCIPLGF